MRRSNSIGEMLPIDVCRRRGLYQPSMNSKTASAASRWFLKRCLTEQFAFERGVETLAHRVIEAIADRPHRGSNASFIAALAERDRRILAALIRVVNDVFGFTPVDRHVERIEHQLGAQMRGHRPADHAPAVHVEHDGQEQEPTPRRHVGDIGNPKLIRCGRAEVAGHQIWRRSCVAIA